MNICLTILLLASLIFPFYDGNARQELFTRRQDSRNNLPPMFTIDEKIAVNRPNRRLVVNFAHSHKASVR